MISQKVPSCSVVVLAVLICACTVFALPEGATGGQGAKAELTSVIQDYGRPLSFRDADGKITGFSVEILEAIAARAGITLRHSFVLTYPDLVKEFSENRGDLTPSIAISEERRKIFDFTEPYEVTPLLLFVRSDSAIGSLKGGMKVGAVRASAAVRFLREKEGVVIAQYTTYQEVVQALMAGQIDAFSASEERVKGMLKEMGIEKAVKAVGPPVGEVRRAIAVKKGTAALIERLNRVIADFVGSAEYQRIYEEWFGRPGP